MLFNHLFRYFHCSHDFLHVQSSDAFYNHPFMWQVFSRTILTTPPGRNSELKNFNDSRLPQHSNSRTGSSSTEFSKSKRSRLFVSFIYRNRPFHFSLTLARYLQVLLLRRHSRHLLRFNSFNFSTRPPILLLHRCSFFLFKRIPVIGTPAFGQ